MKNYCTVRYHKVSTEILKGFVKNYKNSEKRIDHFVNTKTVETVLKNKEYISKECCGQQGIALRGHRDDGFLFKKDHEDQNEGNFRELVSLMAELDKDLENFVVTYKRNATYLPKTSQNDSCIKEYIQQEIVNDSENQKYFWNLFLVKILKESLYVIIWLKHFRVQA